MIIVTTYSILEYRYFWDNGSLLVANIRKNIAYYQGDTSWVTRYNEAIWLAKTGQYAQAKSLIAPLINETTLPKKAEISELYGDLIYHMSGSLDDTITMYERSLSFEPNERIATKIALIKNIQASKTGSWQITKTPTLSGSTASGNSEKDIKKEELKKLWSQRAEFLSNSEPSDTDSRKKIEKLIESTNSDSIEITQDW